MKRIRSNCGMTNRRSMNLFGIHRLGLFLLAAAAVITINVPFLHGQRSVDNADSDTSYSNSTRSVKQANDVFQAGRSKASNSALGRTKVTQASNTMLGKPVPSSNIGPSSRRLPPTNLQASYAQDSQIPTDPMSGQGGPGAPGGPGFSTGPATSILPPNLPVGPTSNQQPPRGVTYDGNDPLLRFQSKQRVFNASPLAIVPNDRALPPGVRGAYFGLTGETATERLFRMQTVSQEVERENEDLRQQNAALQARIKETQDQMVAVVKEIQVARRELAFAKSDLDRLKTDLQTLREKVRMAQKEHTDVLQSMGPLLQQLLESDDVGSLPPKPME